MNRPTIYFDWPWDRIHIGLFWSRNLQIISLSFIGIEIAWEYGTVHYGEVKHD